MFAEGAQQVLEYLGVPHDQPLKTKTEMQVAQKDSVAEDAPSENTADLTAPVPVEVEVARARERGWAQALGEREEDLNAVAAPVLSGTGTLVAILGVQGPAVRFNPRAMQTAVEILLDRASLISAAL